MRSFGRESFLHTALYQWFARFRPLRTAVFRFIAFPNRISPEQLLPFRRAPWLGALAYLANSGMVLESVKERSQNFQVKLRGLRLHASASGTTNAGLSAKGRRLCSEGGACSTCRDEGILGSPENWRLRSERHIERVDPFSANRAISAGLNRLKHSVLHVPPSAFYSTGG